MRCGAFLAKLLNNSYYTLVNLEFGDWNSLINSLCYAAIETISFCLLCWQADSLREAVS